MQRAHAFATHLNPHFLNNEMRPQVFSIWNKPHSPHKAVLYKTLNNQPRNRLQISFDSCEISLTLETPLGHSESEGRRGSTVTITRRFSKSAATTVLGLQSRVVPEKL